MSSDLTLPGHPEVFVVGDLMSLDGLPGVAQVAIQSGRHAAATIRRRLAGDTGSRSFRYRDRGSLATISRFRAVGSIGRLRIAGFPAWLLWLLVHLVWLTGSRTGSSCSPTGRPPSSAAAAPNVQSPSSRCSAARRSPHPVRGGEVVD